MPNNNRPNITAYAIIGCISGGVIILYAGYKLKESSEPVYRPVQGMMILNTSSKTVETPDPNTGGTMILTPNTGMVNGQLVVIDANQFGITGLTAIPRK